MIPSFVISNENGSIIIDRLLTDFWANIPGQTTNIEFIAIKKIDIVIKNTQINKLFLSVKIDGYTRDSELKSFISVIPYDLPDKYNLEEDLKEDLLDVIQYLRETTEFNKWQEDKYKSVTDA